jgi:hypothetical protein
MPVATVTEHLAPAGKTAVLAVKVKVAVEVPELEAAAVKVVLQPDLDGVPNEASAKVGSTSAMVSSTERGTFNWKVNAADVSVLLSAVVNGFPKTRALCCSAGADTAEDTEIGVLEISVVPAKVTFTTRDAKLAVCVAALVVTPVAIVTVH